METKWLGIMAAAVAAALWFGGKAKAIPETPIPETPIPETPIPETPVEPVTPAKFVYVSGVKHRWFKEGVPADIPVFKEEDIVCNAREDYHCFEVDVKNEGGTAGWCTLNCFLKVSRDPQGLSPIWEPDSKYSSLPSVTAPCSWYPEPYRIKNLFLEPGEIGTFRGLCWFWQGWVFGEPVRGAIVMFTGTPGDIISGGMEILYF